MLSRSTMAEIAAYICVKNQESKIVMIPNGIPLYAFHNVDESVGKNRRQKLGILGIVTVIAMVGMLHENKGHKYFIEAASITVSRKPKTMFLIIGDGELRIKLEQLVASLK